jgi:YD repeat-containing protein
VGDKACGEGRPGTPGSARRDGSEASVSGRASSGGATNTIAYRRDGDVDSATDADGLVTTYGYDNLGRVATKTVVSGSFPAGLTTGYGLLPPVSRWDEYGVRHDEECWK